MSGTVTNSNRVAPEDSTSSIMPDQTQLPHDAFKRVDESPDEAFYQPPRLVTHIDDTAIAAVTDLYRRRFPPGGVILDLMSSWVSHLPDDVAFARVVGHGMNRQEMAANRRLDDFFLKNLNRDPSLDFDDDTFDGVAICVSIQYLTQPIEVIREVGRILKPNAPLVVTYSNRCFPTKAVYIWQALSMDARAMLVRHYMEEAGNFHDVETLQIIAEGEPTDPLFAVIGYAGNAA